jgi:hypothetical protein
MIKDGVLLGIAVKDSFVYAYYTCGNNNKLYNKVVRLKDRVGCKNS